MKINIKVFYKLILSFWVCGTRHTQSTQNKFAYLSNISRKAWEMKLIFCLQINTSFLQVDSITLGVFSQACPKYPKQQVYNIFAISQRECEGMKLIFCLLINLKGFFKVILSFKVCVARHAQFDQNNKFAISLQYCKK